MIVLKMNYARISKNGNSIVKYLLVSFIALNEVKDSMVPPFNPFVN